MSAIVKHPFLQRLLRVPPAYYVFAILLITLWIARPHMLNANIMGIFIRQVAPLGVLVLAQLLVMRVKSIDLSGGGIILLVNYFISSGIFPGASMPFFIGLSLATGTAIGLFNGWMIGKRRVSAVIVTLAVSIILVGFVQYLSSGKPPGDVPSYLNDIYNIKWGPAPVPVLFWFALTVVMALFLSIVLRQIASMVAVVGALVFAAALLRGFAERRRGDLSGSSSRRSVVWRGRIIEIQENRLSLAERVRRAVRRWRE